MTFYAPTHFVFAHTAARPWYLDIQPSGTGRTQWNNANTSSSTRSTTLTTESITTTRTAESRTSSIDAVSAITSSESDTSGTQALDATTEGTTLAMSIHPLASGTTDASGYVRLDADAGWLLAEFGNGQILTTGTLLPMPFAAGEYQVTVHVEAGSVAVTVPEPGLWIALIGGLVIGLLRRRVK